MRAPMLVMVYKRSYAARNGVKNARFAMPARPEPPATLAPGCSRTRGAIAAAFPCAAASCRAVTRQPLASPCADTQNAFGSFNGDGVMAPLNGFDGDGLMVPLDGIMVRWYHETV